MTFKKLIRIFYPSKCSQCRKIIPLEREYCTCYKDEIRFTEAGNCEHCGHTAESCLCSEDEAIKLHHVTAPFYYVGTIRAKIHSLKFSGEKSEAKFLASSMTEKVREAFPDVKFDCATFVPMTALSEKKRGFNQSRLLCKIISKNLNIPMSELIEKTHETENQHNLTQKERIKNIENCFDVFGDEIINIKGKRILLIDDVKTTGKTLSECESVLLNAGADDVYCLVASITDFEKYEI